MGIKRESSFVRHPPQEFKLLPGDVFVVFGHAGAIPNLSFRAKSKVAAMHRGMAI